jgi:CRISPR/Cas system-associated exonuclease Cas4 (RecB family)
MNIESSVKMHSPHGITGELYTLAIKAHGSLYPGATGLRASSIGTCNRQHLYKLVQLPDGGREVTPDKSLLTMHLGTVLGDNVEGMVSDMVNIMGVLEDKRWNASAQVELVSYMQAPNAKIKAVTHPDLMYYRINDGVIDEVHIIDVKSSNPFAFKNQKRDDGSLHHKAQVAMSMLLMEYMKGKPSPFYNNENLEYYKVSPDVVITGEIFYISRADGEYFSVPVRNDEYEQTTKWLIELCDCIREGRDPGPNPRFGVKGDSKTWECNYCDFRQACDNNTNPFDYPWIEGVDITVDKA